jgi:3-methylfumaryl-CoA hydratase
VSKSACATIFDPAAKEIHVNLNDAELRAWVGRSETVRDQIGATPVAALTATLDHPAAPVVPGTPLPPLWHWLYFLPMHRQSEIGTDGHAQRGGFLPPVPLPRRMWAGSQFEFRAPIRVGDAVERTSTIADVSVKEGRTGRLVFVKVRHELRCNGAAEPALLEFHDIVYREAKQPGDVEPPPQPAPEGAVWHRELVPDDVLLFRYSALTFNGHRIHYDRRYVTTVEGYPGLIVHGPLIATLLLDLLRRQAPDADVASFRFKAVRPTFDLHPFSVNGAPQADGTTIRLWATDHDGWLTMDATATLR